MANTNYAEVAKVILEAIGGKDNVASAAHCATRLRLVLNDESKVNKAEIEKMDVVKGVFSTAGQFQIIIGQGTVNRVYAELASLAGIQEMSTADVKDAAMEKLNPFQRFCRMLSNIFVPNYSCHCSCWFINGYFRSC